MSHFDIGEWADFTRGLVEPSRREAMEAHVASGCGKCGRLAVTLGKAARIAQMDAQYEVPEYAVHCARAIFSLHQPERVRILPRVISRLVFDSFTEPLPVGVRAQHRLSRQTLYEAGRYALDLRQERECDSARVTLVGQIADRQAPGRSLAGVPVVLKSGRAVVAQAISNEFGEFQVEYDSTRRIRLQVGVEESGEGHYAHRRCEES
jgi:hypothetical protein